MSHTAPVNHRLLAREQLAHARRLADEGDVGTAAYRLLTACEHAVDELGARFDEPTREPGMNAHRARAAVASRLARRGVLARDFGPELRRLDAARVEFDRAGHVSLTAGELDDLFTSAQTLVDACLRPAAVAIATPAAPVDFDPRAIAAPQPLPTREISAPSPTPLHPRIETGSAPAAPAPAHHRGRPSAVAVALAAAALLVIVCAIGIRYAQTRPPASHTAQRAHAVTDMLEQTFGNGATVTDTRGRELQTLGFLPDAGPVKVRLGVRVDRACRVYRDDNGHVPAFRFCVVEKASPTKAWAGTAAPELLAAYTLRHLRSADVPAERVGCMGPRAAAFCRP